MRKLILALALLALPLAAHAQQANLTSPQSITVPTGATTTATATHIIVMSAQEDRDSATATVVVAKRDAGGNVLQRATFTFPDPNGPCPSATLNDYFAARNNPRANEVGPNTPRATNFRVLGLLVDKGCIPPVTLVP